MDYQQILKRIKNTGKISSKDDIYFEHIYDILNDLFDYSHQAYMRGTKRFNNWKILWFPKLKYKHYGEERPGTKNWLNYLNIDKTIFYEDARNGNTTPDYKYWNNRNLERAVFAGVRENRLLYKFFGIFQFCKINGSLRIYERISDEMDLNEWILDKR